MSEQSQTEPPEAPAYPFYVRSDEDKRRFDLSLAIAAETMGVEPTSGAAWSAARVLYGSDIPT